MSADIPSKYPELTPASITIIDTMLEDYINTLLEALRGIKSVPINQIDDYIEKILALNPVQICGQTWYSVSKMPPELYQNVIRSDYSVEGKPEWDNQTIDHLTKDCNTGEVKWSNARRKPHKDELWTVLPKPPIKTSDNNKPSSNSPLKIGDKTQYGTIIYIDDTHVKFDKHPELSILLSSYTAYPTKL